MPSRLDFSKPILLRPDNFTPLTRTPWAGTSITTQFKDKVVPEALGEKVGESWEFSCDPSFPSYVAGHDLTLANLVAKYPEQTLGRAAGDAHGFCEILIKLLSVDAPLSLQIHPADDDPDLEPEACGKPESWYILHAEKGAGLYLGYSRAMTREELRELILSGASVESALQFVPVTAGDYFEIQPGVPHALGKGLTLLEPQRVLLGKSGMTFRMWDWQRRYDENGKVDLKTGKPRALHLEQALKLTDPLTQVGMEFVNSCRRISESKVVASCEWMQFPENPYYQVHILKSNHSGKVRLKLTNGYGALVVLGGEVRAAEQEMIKGQNALLPYKCFPLSVAFDQSAMCAVVVPRGARFSVQTDD